MTLTTGTQPATKTYREKAEGRMAASVSDVEKSMSLRNRGQFEGLGPYCLAIFFTTLRISDWTRTQKRRVWICFSLDFLLDLQFPPVTWDPMILDASYLQKTLPFQITGWFTWTKKHAGLSKSVFPACHLSDCIITRVSPSMMKFINRIGFGRWVAFTMDPLRMKHQWERYIPTWIRWFLMGFHVGHQEYTSRMDRSWEIGWIHCRYSNLAINYNPFKISRSFCWIPVAAKLFYQRINFFGSSSYALYIGSSLNIG